MFVVEVWTLVEPSLAKLSAGSPERLSVIATNEDQVSRAYWRSWSDDTWVGTPRAATPRAGVTATGRSTHSATSPATPAVHHSLALLALIAPGVTHVEKIGNKTETNGLTI
jgi:hypothetical protein